MIYLYRNGLDIIIGTQNMPKITLRKKVTELSQLEKKINIVKRELEKKINKLINQHYVENSRNRITELSIIINGILETVEMDANARIDDYNRLDKKVDNINKDLKKIHEYLILLRDADDKEIKKRLAEINVEEKLVTYDQERRGKIDTYLNTYTAKLKSKLKQIKEKMENIMKKIKSMDGYPTEVHSDEKEERGTMNVEKLQQRVDDILKF